MSGATQPDFLTLYFGPLKQDANRRAASLRSYLQFPVFRHYDTALLGLTVLSLRILSEDPNMMSVVVPTDWSSYQGEGFVSIANRRVHVNVRGPARKQGTPLIICEAGHGDSSHVWAAVQSRTAQFARILTYDRAGMGHSDPGPNPRTAAAAAKDLSDVLEAAKLSGPFVVVSHSYGGIVAREFLHIRSCDISGMIFVDTITELYSTENCLPMKEFGAVLGNLTFWDVTGITSTHKFSETEWKLINKTWPNDESTSAAEEESIRLSEQNLAGRNQCESQPLGNRPITIIKGNATQDFRSVLVAGEAAGNGTESDRETIRQFVKTSEEARERHQRSQLRLSTNSRFVLAPHGHHMVQFVDPDLIVEEIKNILNIVA